MLKEQCNRATAKCEGSGKPIVNNTKELLEGKAPISFDLTHKKNLDFKRFDLIPET